VQRPQRSEDERRGQRRAPAHHDTPRKTTHHVNPPTERQPPPPFTTPVGGARLEGNEGPDQMPFGLWRTRQGYAGSSLAPGPSPLWQPERRQMTREVA
jgi:hypothetical protein